MQLIAHRFDLLLRHPFVISKGTRNSQPSLIVELQQDGYSGYGEAPAIFYYGVTVEGLTEQAMQIRDFLANKKLTTPEALWTLLAQKNIHPFLRSALDEAAYDLYGKIHQIPTWKYIGGHLTNLPITNFTLGLSSPQELLQKIQETPWPAYKIKLGPEDALQTVELIRNHTHAQLRVDANAAWTVDQTLALAPKLKALGVTFIEQPLAVDDIRGMKRLFTESPLPIFADESCQTEEDIAKAAGLFHGVNIKLAKCGGITPARRMIAEARQRGLQVMVGCMVESSVGISAIAQLLPFLDIADLDGALLLKNNPAHGVSITDGVVSFAGDGNGVVLK
ncbi:MAG TPA: dipeptide epimerase [Saprospiraceae bacterium]|nr:dipeptide epimerase [Saprospiraceae bacterium]